MSSIAAASAVSKEVVQGIGDLLALLASYKDRKINSLTEFNKKTLISSRVYIEDNIAAEPLIPSLMKLALRTYSGMVFTALGLSNLIVHGKPVRNLLAAVATENFKDANDLIEMFSGMPKMNVEPSFEAQAVNTGDKEKDKEVEKVITALNSGKDKNTKVEAEDLFCGKIMDVTIGTAKDNITIPFIVQLFPYILPKVVMEEFMSNHIDPPKALRKAQYKAGEISFWKDYIFECDRVRKRKKALMADKDGILREVEDARTAAQNKGLLNFIVEKGSINRNAASSITIIRKSTLDKLCRDFGVNMRNLSDRQRIFTNIMGMMIFAYDPDYNTIDLYMNGVQAHGEYTASMVQSAAKKDDAFDLKTLLTIMAAGNAPKF